MQWLVRLLVVIAVAWVSDIAVPAELPHVPDGYTVQLVAGSDLVQHPMMGCFDERGRLFICESAGTNRPASELIADPQDSIRVLEDTDGDGAFDKSTVFADKLVFPQGCLWYRGALYTCSSPYLWKLEDTDDDGVCDRRTVLVKSFGFSGNAADIHGPFLSPDGRIYWCDGRHGHEIRDLGEGEFGGDDNVTEIEPQPEPGLPNPEGELLTKGKAARIFSCRPDGSDVRVLCGGGMDNPVEVDFWETGECVGTVNLFYGSPRGDCVVHWVQGGVYPRFDQQDSIAEFKSTGDLLPEVHNYGHVAVSGMTRYRSDQFFGPPDETADRADFFVTQFNTHKVVHTVLQRSGATFAHVETSDFFVSDDPDCHPTDVIEDADGSLLVVDTGGWFRIGCPTSQIAKPEIAGAIYRMRKVGAHAVPDPLGVDIAWDVPQRDAEAMAALLTDARPAVRARAVDELAMALERDSMNEPSIVSAVHPSQNDDQHANLLWALARTSFGNSVVSQYCEYGNTPRQLVTAFTAAGSIGAVNSGYGLLGGVQEEDLSVCRAALDALGPYHRADGRQELMDGTVGSVLRFLRSDKLDRCTEHAAIHTVILLNRPASTATLLEDESPRVRRAALIALDQMDGGNLTREQVLPLLETDDPALQKTVLDVISRREGWATETTSLLGAWLEEELTDDRARVVRTFLAAQARDPAVQQLIASKAVDANIPAASRALLLEVMQSATSQVEELPDAWSTAIAGLLQQDDAASRQAAMRVAQAFPSDRFDAALAAIADDEQQPASLRVEALTTLAPRVADLSDARFALLETQLVGAADPLDKLAAARALAASPLSSEQLAACAGRFDDAGPLATSALLEAFTASEQPGALRMLIEGLGREPAALDTIPPHELARILRDVPEDVRQPAAELLAELSMDTAAQQARLESLAHLVDGGDPGRGRYVFTGQTAACNRCHRVGDDGAQIGPDLTKIAAIRQPRDLLEAIVFPSASFARGYRSYAVLTFAGAVHSGILPRETADEIVLQTTDLREIRIRREDIEELKESDTSIMPQGLETRLSEEELRDLMAYLQTLK
jgi:putative membrane-bound dehydrogenase-like protein